jgi:hypothetical protein
MKLHVATKDGANLVVEKVEIADAIAFERHYREPVSIVSDRPFVEYVAFLAFSALKRTGAIATATDFEAFVGEIADFSIEGEDEDDAGKASETAAP